MFDTSIHWTTFFYLLIDLLIVLIVFIRSVTFKSPKLDRFLILGTLFILYNASGGFLPLKDFTELLFLQYIISYSVAIILCIYIIYFIYKEYDLRINIFLFRIKNMAIWLTLLFTLMFVLPYTITNSLIVARLSFTIPLAFIALYFFWLFCKKVKATKESCPYLRRRKDLSILSIGAVTLLPTMTVLGDYQWLTFTIMNTSFYALLVIEIDRYIHSIKEKYKFLSLQSGNENNIKFTSLADYKLTPREIDISVSILEEKSYKTIGDDFFIAERTVSKHASNIFKKTGATNRKEFFKKFNENSA